MADLLQDMADGDEGYGDSEGNKVSANTYRAKKLIRPVAMKLKKFHACPNHCILYRGKYEKLRSCPHYGVSQYKRKSGCRTEADDERALKKKKVYREEANPIAGV
uniref:Uncharacterized protein n=1 Tax=Sorghum bicolor TaxID=4558 RepID=C6JRK8_SORBI